MPTQRFSAFIIVCILSALKTYIRGAIKKFCNSTIKKNASNATYSSFLQSDRIACNAERCISHGNSVHPSVCLSHAGTLPRRTKIGSLGRHCEAGKHCSFLITTDGWERCPLPNLHSKWPAPSEKRRLRPISAYTASVSLSVRHGSRVYGKRPSVGRWHRLQTASPLVVQSAADRAKDQTFHCRRSCFWCCCCSYLEPSTSDSDLRWNTQ